MLEFGLLFRILVGNCPYTKKRSQFFPDFYAGIHQSEAEVSTEEAHTTVNRMKGVIHD